MSFIKLVIKNSFKKKNKATLAIFGIIFGTVIINLILMYTIWETNISIYEKDSTLDFIIEEKDNFNSITNDPKFINEYEKKINEIPGINKTIITLHELVLEENDEEFIMRDILLH